MSPPSNFFLQQAAMMTCSPITYIDCACLKLVMVVLQSKVKSLRPDRRMASSIFERKYMICEVKFDMLEEPIQARHLEAGGAALCVLLPAVQQGFPVVQNWPWIPRCGPPAAAAVQPFPELGHHSAHTASRSFVTCAGMSVSF